MFTIAQTGQVYQKSIKDNYVREFNTQIEKYSGRNITAQEVATLINYVHTWNNENSPAITMNADRRAGVAVANIDSLIQAINTSNRTEEFLSNELTENMQRQEEATPKEIIYRIEIDDIHYDENGRISEFTITKQIRNRP